MNKIENVKNFHFPRWEELPEEPIFNKEVVEYINTTLEPIITKELEITATMIQNYSKWRAIPKINGRKYGRVQIAILIVINLFKDIIQIDNIREGVVLQLAHVEEEVGYNLFAETVERALKKVFANVGNPETELTFDPITFPEKTEGLHAVAFSYAFKLLGKIIIEQGGYKNIN